MIARPSSDASRCVTGWSTVASGIGSTPLSTPSRPMIARSTVAILPSSKPIDELLRRIVDGQRRRARGRERAHGPARPQVVGPDLGARRQVEALARTLAGQWVFPSWLDRGRRDRRAQIARPRDVVLAPQHQPRGHRVLGEVRMGPLVDVVGLAVSPVLQELHGRPGVIDLVEMRLVRLFQAEGPHPERRQQQDDQDPRVEAIQSPAALPEERPAPIRPHRAFGESGPDPAHEAAVGERGARAPCGQVGRRSAGAATRRPRCRSRRAGSMPRDARRRGHPDGGAPLGRRQPAAASAAPDRPPGCPRRGGSIVHARRPRAAPPPARRRVVRGRSLAAGARPSRTPPYA